MAKHALWITVFSALSILPSVRAQACSPDQIRVTSHWGYSIKLGSEGLEFADSRKTMTSLPFVVDGQRACVDQRDSLELKHTSSADGSSGELAAIFPTAEFEGVQNGRVDTYALLNRQGLPTSTTRLNLVSVTCAGETPLAIQAFSGRLDETPIAARELSVRSTMFIATGAAARHIQRLLPGQMGEIPAPLRETFLSRVGSKGLRTVRSRLVQMPDVILANHLSTNAGVSTRSSTTTMNLEKYACTNHFRETMRDLRVDAWPEAFVSGPFEIRHDSEQGLLKIRWRK